MACYKQRAGTLQKRCWPMDDLMSQANKKGRQTAHYGKRLDIFFFKCRVTSWFDLQKKILVGLQSSVIAWAWTKSILDIPKELQVCKDLAWRSPISQSTGPPTAGIPQQGCHHRSSPVSRLPLLGLQDMGNSHYMGESRGCQNIHNEVLCHAYSDHFSPKIPTAASSFSA